MKSPHKLIACSAITALLCIGALAQSPGAEINHFAQDGLAFEYPAGWLITDESTPQALQLILRRKGTSVQVIIVAKRGVTLRNELQTAHREITEPLVARVATMLGKTGRPVERMVTVQVIIDEQGNVSEARAVSGHPLLQAVCVAAARQARFLPMEVEDEPVKVTGVITYNFVAQ
jgi:TonB family protein